MSKVNLEKKLEDLWRSGDLEGAAKVAEDLLDQEKDHKMALQFLAKWKLSRGNFKAAVEYWKKLSEVSVSHLEIFVGLSQAEEFSGNLHGAIKVCRQGLRTFPGNYFLLFMLGLLFEKVSQEKKATTAFFHCVLNYENASGLDDKDFQNRQEAHRSQIDYAKKHLNTSLNSKYLKTVRNFEEKVGKEFLTASTAKLVKYAERPVTKNPLFQPRVVYVKSLKPKPWFERKEFDWLPSLENHLEDIKQEFENNFNSETDLKPYLGANTINDGGLETLANTTNWGAVYFYYGSKKIEETHARFPITSKIIESLPLFRVNGQADEALFSILRPGVRISPHFGINNCRLTCHLPLFISGESFLRVGEEVRKLEEGKSLIFDDSFIHEAWNTSDDLRIVLIYEIWRPELSPEEKQVLEKGQQAEKDWVDKRYYFSLFRD